MPQERDKHRDPINNIINHSDFSVNVFSLDTPALPRTGEGTA